MYDKLVYKDEIKNIMLRIGVFGDVLENDKIYDIIPDSLTFVTFIIEIEQEFNIEIPDELLNPEQMGTIKQLDQFLVKHIHSSLKSEPFYKKIFIAIKNILCKRKEN